MRYLTVLALFLLGLSSCKQNNNSVAGVDFSTMEADFAKNPNDSTYDKLITAYLESLHVNAKDEKLKEQILNKAIAAAEKVGKTSQQIIFLNNLIKEFPDRKENKKDIIKLVQLLKSSGKSPAGDVMALCYAKLYPDDEAVKDLTQGIPSGSTPDSYILEIGKSIFMDSISGFDKSKAMLYVDACEAYALAMPKDDQTPEYIFKAAETSNTLRTFDKSFSLYDWIIDRYSNNKRGPMALFMKAFLFDSALQDSTNARKFYNEFIVKYPNHEFTKDAKQLLSNIGKSDEQVLKELMEKNPKK